MRPTDSTMSRRVTAEVAAAHLIALTVPSFAQPFGNADEKKALTAGGAGEPRGSQAGGLGDGNVLAYFPVAVGAEESPSPTGEFQIWRRALTIPWGRAGWD